MVVAVKHGRGSVLISAAVIIVFWCSNITLNGEITARDYVDMVGNQLHPMILTLFQNNDAVFEDDNVPIHAAVTV
jgi:hypothetical protein